MGERMPCATCTDRDVQNAYWEGFTQCDEVINLFVWNLVEEIIHAAVNFPGSWHYSRFAAASGFYYQKLSHKTPCGYAILGYSAFPLAAPYLQVKVVRAQNSNERGDSSDAPQSTKMAAVDMFIQRSMPSKRQSAEWGYEQSKGLLQG